MIVKRYSASHRKISIHHGGATSGQTYTDDNQTYEVIDNKLTLTIQLSDLHTNKNSGDTYASVNDNELKLADNYMTLANPKGSVDFTITAYKNSGDDTGLPGSDQEYKNMRISLLN